MRYSEYTNYLKSIADAHVDIKAFVRIISVDWPRRNLNLEHYFSRMRSSDFDFPFMVSESYITKTKDWRGGQQDKLYEGAFLIIARAERNNFSEEDAKYDACEQIADEVVGYIMNEFTQHWNSSERGKRFFEPNSLSTELVGGFGDNLLGVRVMFGFSKNVAQNYEYQPTKFGE